MTTKICFRDEFDKKELLIAKTMSLPSPSIPLSCKNAKITLSAANFRDSHFNKTEKQQRGNRKVLLSNFYLQSSTLAFHSKTQSRYNLVQHDNEQQRKEQLNIFYLKDTLWDFCHRRKGYDSTTGTLALRKIAAQ